MVAEASRLRGRSRYAVAKARRGISTEQIWRLVLFPRAPRKLLPDGFELKQALAVVRAVHGSFGVENG